MTKREVILLDIKEHPENHKHSFEELNKCAKLDGILDLSIIEAHAGLCGWNGRPCDTISGPCSCGGWHSEKDMTKEDIANTDENQDKDEETQPLNKLGADAGVVLGKDKSGFPDFMDNPYIYLPDKPDEPVNCIACDINSGYKIYYGYCPSCWLSELNAQERATLKGFEIIKQTKEREGSKWVDLFLFVILITWVISGVFCLAQTTVGKDIIHYIGTHKIVER